MSKNGRWKGAWLLLYPIGLPRGREGEGGGFSITLPPPGHTLSCLAFGARLPCSKHRVLSQDLWLQYISYARSELAENPNRTPGTNSDVFVLRYRTRIDREREREKQRGGENVRKVRRTDTRRLVATFFKSTFPVRKNCMSCGCAYVTSSSIYFSHFFKLSLSLQFYVIPFFFPAGLPCVAMSHTSIVC